MKTVPPCSRNFLVSLLFTIFGGPGIIVVYLPAALIYLSADIPRWRVPPSPIPLQALAWILIVGGLLPHTESIARFIWAGRGTLAPFAPTQTLVVSGLYRYVRNPMYVGDLAAIAGEAHLFRSFSLVVHGGLVCLGFSPVCHAI